MLKKTRYTPAELIEGLRRNEQNAFEECYDLYAAALYGVICRTVPDEQAAGILLREVFLEFHKNIWQYESGSCSIFTWMMRICRNKASVFHTYAQKPDKLLTAKPVTYRKYFIENNLKP